MFPGHRQGNGKGREREKEEGLEGGVVVEQRRGGRDEEGGGSDVEVTRGQAVTLWAIMGSELTVD